MKINLYKDIIVGRKYYGFYMRIGQRDIFLKTNYKIKSKALLSEICHELMIPNNPDIFRELKYYLRPATFEIKYLGNGKRIIDIVGDGFNYGDFLDKNVTDFYLMKV